MLNESDKTLMTERLEINVINKDIGERQLPENYRPALEESVPEGRACGNCFYYDESRISPEGDKAYCDKWGEYVRGDHYCNAWEDKEPDDSVSDDEQASFEIREVNLTPPAYMRAAARRGLRYHEQGESGDGLKSATVSEARAMAAGNVTADKWVRIAAWIARHMEPAPATTASRQQA